MRRLAFVGAWLAATAVAVIGWTPTAWGADPIPYKVKLQGAIGNDIQSTLAASSDLVTLRKSAPVSPVGLILRARDDTVRLKVVLESFGYYQSAVTATIDGASLISADLAAKLAALPAGREASVVVSYTPGPLYHLGLITLQGDLPAAMRGQLKLRPGQPAVAADVLGAGTQLLTSLRNEGYAFAKVDAPVAYELPKLRELEVTFNVHTGALARLGHISVIGLKRTRLSAVLSRLRLHTGERYSAKAVDQARRNLLAMGVFGTVDVTIAPAPDADGAVPVTFTVTERKRHEVTLNGAYSSDLGGSGGVTWTDRNVFRGAEQLSLSASVINLSGSATDHQSSWGGIGYDTGAKLIVPEFLHPAQTLQVSVDAIKQSLLAYDQRAETAGITLTRNLSKIWSASVGFSTTRETILQPEEVVNFPQRADFSFDYTLYAIPLTVRYDTTGLDSPLLDPTHGIRAAVTVSPTLSLGPPNATFVISQVRASAYLDMHGLLGTDPGRTVVAVRALSGYAQGARVIDLPPDQRFYAGGSGTIRGFRFQSVGPQFPIDNTPEGGIAVDAGSVELRQRVGTHYGFALFADGGSVSQTAIPFSGQFRWGVGAGLRYYTPIGPLRVDFALPLRRRPDDDRFEVYIGLGQSF